MDREDNRQHRTVTAALADCSASPRVVSAVVFGFALALILTALILVTEAQAQADAPFIAGTTPSVRPVGAPVITKTSHDKAWFAKALTGVSEPHPKSLDFLQNQGAWYTPFTRPGMVSRYDIRLWHTKK